MHRVHHAAAMGVVVDHIDPDHIDPIIIAVVHSAYPWIRECHATHDIMPLLMTIRRELVWDTFGTPPLIPPPSQTHTHTCTMHIHDWHYATAD